MKTKLALVAVVFLLMSCGNQSPKRSSPQEVLTSTSVSAAKVYTDATPKLDVLIVVDNSLSMKPQQIHLLQNIPKFVEEFDQSATIDFHIGVLTLWDSDPSHQPFVQAKHPFGQLIPMVNKSAPAVGTPPHFVGRDTPDRDKLLQDTILLGEEYGPEFEETFSPVKGFFDSLSSPANANFYRADAHLLVIFLTDANDSSDITAQTFYDYIKGLKNQDTDLIHFYSIIADGSCKTTDRAGAPIKYIALDEIAGGNTTLSLCSPTFGADLASFGKTLSVKVARQVIPLQNGWIDSKTPFKVSFGSQVINRAVTPPSFSDGYILDRENGAITIPGDLPLKPEAGAKIKIDYLPIDGTNMSRGHVHAGQAALSTP
jgi:hypothetical protein